MYENDNFSGYGTGNENTTGTFSGADLNETRTENSYGYENHSTTQSAAGSTNGYTTYQMRPRVYGRKLCICAKIHS